VFLVFGIRYDETTPLYTMLLVVAAKRYWVSSFFLSIVLRDNKILYDRVPTGDGDKYRTA